MPTVFLCMRPGDCPDVTGRIGDRMRAAFGPARIVQPFDLGRCSQERLAALTAEVRRCSVLVAMIGPDWKVHSLCDPTDGVRSVLLEAISQSIPVIPVFVGGANPPTHVPEPLHNLPFHNGLAMRPDPDFRRDMEKLIQAVRSPIPVVAQSPEHRILSLFSRMRSRLIFGAALGFLTGIALSAIMAIFHGLTRWLPISESLLLVAGMGAVCFGWRRPLSGWALGSILGLGLPLAFLAVGVIIALFLAAILCSATGEHNFLRMPLDLYMMPVYLALFVSLITGVLTASVRAGHLARTGADPELHGNQIGAAGTKGIVAGAILGAFVGWFCTRAGSGAGQAGTNVTMALMMLVPPISFAGMALSGLSVAFPPRGRKRA